MKAKPNFTPSLVKGMLKQIPKDATLDTVHTVIACITETLKSKRTTYDHSNPCCLAKISKLSKTLVKPRMSEIDLRLMAK